MCHKTEQEVMNNWKGSEDEPFVSVCCTTYNHEPYIADALDSFLMQETDFSFEVLVRDDCSTDRTAAIIKSYAEKYPKIIKPIYEKENTFSKGIKPMQQVLKIVTGKYAATCEGDDYWTDPQKLQKQVDFLEKNKEFAICGHDAFVIDETGKRVKDSKLPNNQKKDFSKEDLILGNAWVLTLSMLFRKSALTQLPPELPMVNNGDKFIVSLLGNSGKYKFMSEIKPACYRAHQGGVWSHSPLNDQLDELVNTYYWMYRYYKRMKKNEYANKLLILYYERVLTRIEYTKSLNDLGIKKIFRILMKVVLQRIKSNFYDGKKKGL